MATACEKMIDEMVSRPALFTILLLRPCRAAGKRRGWQLMVSWGGRPRGFFLGPTFARKADAEKERRRVAREVERDARADLAGRGGDTVAAHLARAAWLLSEKYRR